MLRFGTSRGFIDHPDGTDLKSHTGSPVPLGGVGVFAGIHTGLVVMGSFELGLFLATGLVLVVGLVDDRRGLSPRLRLGVSVLAGTILAVIGDPPDGLWPKVATVFLVVVVINAVNMLDGMDGLAGSVGATSALGLAVFTSVLSTATPWDPLVVAAALLGFLAWNLPTARLYLGDNGAYVLGVSLAWAALRTASDWATGLLAVAVIGIPLVEMSAIVVRRLVARRELFGGDRDHIYDRLRVAGWSVTKILVVFVLAQGLWAAIVIGLAAGIGGVPAVPAVLLLGLAVVSVAAFSGRTNQ
jgi:UDP-GlcNAc:undecaprenyl-phosphate GlcNAc-1-phosphate transferase